MGCYRYGDVGKWRGGSALDGEGEDPDVVLGTSVHSSTSAVHGVSYQISNIPP